MRKETFIKRVGAEEADALVSAVTSYDSASKQFDEAKKKFTKDTGYVVKVMEETKGIILRGAEAHKLRTIPAGRLTCEIKSRKTAKIDAGKLWGLAIKQKLAKQFYTVVNPLVGKAKALFGEKVLKDYGAMTEDVNNYHSIKIV